MPLTRLASIALLALAVAVGGAIYSPEWADRFAPPIGAVARRIRDRIWTPSTQPAASPSNQAVGPAPISVTVTTVKRGDFPVVLTGLGQVLAYNTVLVRARVDGEITKIAFKEGGMVKQGDLLAQIDLRPFQATLDAAVAKKNQDEATLANAKLDLARYSTLAKQNFATQQQLDTQNSLVNQLAATIAADTASVEAAQVQLGYTTIRAPISGRVGFRLIDEGNLVNANQQTGIVSIAQLQPISVVFTAPQEYVDRINEELAQGPLPVTVTNAEGKKLAAGKLAISDNQVDVATGTIRLKAEFENQDRALWPGLAVTTELRLGVDRSVLIVPANAVQHAQNGQFVYVVDDQNRAAPKPVKIGAQNVSEAVVTTGLAEGERIVTSGQFLLQPGTQVAVDSAGGS
ncbi:MAG TPA: efflux RND transporter periplasmic adaptor subunit [Roseiarcus sp.]|nr:efflux RND transporter periplasmic adaptor subunit [Roseiarcus sp.]